ncbi:hypothetical protein Hanom_Chr02g00116551 [Helianthus anomalus]
MSPEPYGDHHGNPLIIIRLIIEVWMNDETSLGWTRYTPRFIYLLLVMLFVETMLYFVLNIV